ncbi:Mut7-C RNAse domain-containing protein [Thermodesulfobacteriota bacterium]
MAIRFVADGMLGRLAKWLRILGYDTHYQPFYQEPVMNQYIKEGRLLLSRHRSITEHYSKSFLIKADTVKNQLYEMRNSKFIKSARSMWLTRCLICNLPLQKATPETARDIIPEYVFNQNHKDFRFCGSCKRYFWPGSHRDRILNQLKIWGF